MTEEKIFTISVNSMDHNEWQGWVDFPSSGERVSFQSLLELTKMVSQKLPPESFPKSKKEK